MSVSGLILSRSDLRLVAEQRGGATVARRTFEVIDVVEILIHWYAGRSQHELSASLGVDRKAARKYVGPAVAAGFAPGGPPMAEADWRRLVGSAESRGTPRESGANWGGRGELDQGGTAPASRRRWRIVSQEGRVS